MWVRQHGVRRIGRLDHCHSLVVEARRLTSRKKAETVVTVAT
jgi:hypothetical protein